MPQAADVEQTGEGVDEAGDKALRRLATGQGLASHYAEPGRLVGSGRGRRRQTGPWPPNAPRLSLPWGVEWVMLAAWRQRR